MMKKKYRKVLFLVQLPPPVHGASIINKQVVNNKQILNNYSIKVIPFDFISDIKNIGTFSFYKIFVFCKIYLRLLFNIMFFRPNLIFINLSFTGGAFYRDIIYITLIKIFKIKLLFHIQGKGIYESWQKNKFKKILFKYIFKNSNVICLSKLLVNDLKDVFLGTPYILNNGIKVESLDQIHFLPEREKLTILYLSALAIDKGLLVLLKAAAILNSKNLDFNLKIIGSPGSLTLMDVSNNIMKYNLENKVKVLGAKYNDEKFKEFLESDIFVMPSLNEAFGLVNIEAMQCGLPVISTFEGAIPEIVEDGVTGFLIEKNNAELLAEKIEILLNSAELRKTFGEAGRKKFFEKYTLEIFDQNTIEIFNDVLKVNILHEV